MKEMVVAVGNGSRSAAKWSETKKMEEDDRLRTLECLRGRLLAERVASRTAKQDADLMANKLMELENKLKTEIKARDKAEKRLQFYVKKLQSLKIPFSSDESEPSISSDNSDISSKSSISSSPSKDPDGNHTPKSPNSLTNQKTEKPLPLPLPLPLPSTTTLSQEEPIQLQSNPASKDPNSSSCSQKCSAAAEMETHHQEEDEESVDNSLALVPVSIPAAPPEEVDVGAVLATLRHVRERIQRSMGTRHMINVGSVETRICY